MKLLDLFCGAGGAAMGYHRAGFDEIVGVDCVEQPHYPFRFVYGDALQVLGWMRTHGGRFPIDHADGRREWLGPFEVVHASPPCQAYSVSRNNGCHTDAPKLIPQTRDGLNALDVPYVIENVVGAPLICPILLCGASFDLGVRGLQLARHRLFESNYVLDAPPCRHTPGRTIGVYGHGTNQWHRDLHGDFSVADYRQAMGIDWMPRKVLSQAIPPAYTEYIGRQLLAHLRSQQEQTA